MLAETDPGRSRHVLLHQFGAESVEGGLKLARYTTERSAIIAFRGGFHGRTYGAASVTSSNASFRRHYAPFRSQIYFAPYPYCYRCSFGQKVETCHLECLEYVKEDFHYAIPPENVSAVLFEPVMGEGGYVVPPEKYVKALRKLCDDNGFLLIFDEVQTGLGRTGKIFASDVFGVVPDVLLMGKAVGAGFPLAVVASTKERMGKWESGCPRDNLRRQPRGLCGIHCPVGNHLEGRFLASVRKKGEGFRNKLRPCRRTYSEIGDVRGVGMMNGIELVKEDKAPDPDKARSFENTSCEKKVILLSSRGL